MQAALHHFVIELKALPNSKFALTTMRLTPGAAKEKARLLFRMEQEQNKFYNELNAELKRPMERAQFIKIDPKGTADNILKLMRIELKKRLRPYQMDYEKIIGPMEHYEVQTISELNHGQILHSLPEHARPISLK